MSNLKIRTAAEQCAEYVGNVRIRERRAAADRAVHTCVRQMHRQFGAELTMGALIRYVGVILVQGARKAVVQESCRFLAKCIARSIVKRLLTRPPMLH